MLVSRVAGGAAAITLGAVALMAPGAASASTTYPELVQPEEISLMVQVSHVKDSPESLSQLRSRLEDIRTEHRDPARGGFVRNLVLTDIGGIVDGSPQLDETVLDVIAPYLPGGETRAFDNVFVGTLLEPMCEDAYESDESCGSETPGWSPYTDGILDQNLRDQHVAYSVDLATQFVETYPSVLAHWYISWEGFLPDLMRDVTYAASGEVTMGPDEHAAIRDAYLDYQSALIRGLNSVQERAILWSPAIQQSMAQLVADKQVDAVAANIDDYFTALEEQSGTNRIWIALQDTLGRCGLYGNSVETTIAWHDFIAAQHTFANLAINAETFTCGDWMSAATRETVRHRLMDYSDRGITLGASFDLDRWYEAVHQMPWPNP